MKQLFSKINAVKGDLFDPLLGLDGYAAFVPCGLTAFRWEAKNFVNCDKKCVPVFYEENPRNLLYTPEQARNMVFRALNYLYKNGARNIGMNGIRLGDGSPYSEDVTYRAAKDWCDANPYKVVQI